MERKVSEGMEKDFGAGGRDDGCCHMFDKIKRKVYDKSRINRFRITIYPVIRVYVRY